MWLLRGLPAVALSSPSSGKRFRMFPFLFERTVETQLASNWAHSDGAWQLELLRGLMASLPLGGTRWPTDLAGIPGLLAYLQTLG